jgi:hypothetical protein
MENSSTIHKFTGGPHIKKTNEAPHINTSRPLTAFTLSLAEVIKLLVVQINWCYQQYFDTQRIFFTP